MTIATVPELIQALNAVKNRIHNEHADYICVALHCARDDGLCTARASRELREYVSASLDGHSSLEFYLQSLGALKVEIVERRLRIVVPGIDITYCPVATDYLRPARLAWIDLMIQSLNDIGRLPQLHSL